MKIKPKPATPLTIRREVIEAKDGWYRWDKVYQILLVSGNNLTQPIEKSLANQTESTGIALAAGRKKGCL